MCVYGRTPNNVVLCTRRRPDPCGWEGGVRHTRHARFRCPAAFRARRSRFLYARVPEPTIIAREYAENMKTARTNNSSFVIVPTRRALRKSNSVEYAQIRTTLPYTRFSSHGTRASDLFNKSNSADDSVPRGRAR